MIISDEKFIRSQIKPRKKDSYKGDFGKVLIYAGSVGMAGAAVLCARAALRSGAGLVRLLLPSMDSRLLDIFQVSVPEATCVAFHEGMELSDYDAIAAGPGLGRGKEASSILEYILADHSGALVLDADALNMISGSERLQEIFRSKSPRAVITPHVGEALRLLGKDSACGRIKTATEREAAVISLIEKYRCTVLLKGHDTLIGNGSELFVNTTGGPGMATGGSGDVLTGIIAALCAQGHDTLHAALIGAYIHGLAGDMAAGELGEIGMISSDIIRYLPQAFKNCAK